ncbi:signal peptidase I [Nocardioides pacificus]
MTNVIQFPGTRAHTVVAPSHRAAPTRSPLSMVGTVLRKLGKLTINLLLVLCLVAFLGLAVGPHLFGYRTITMLTGSMAPMINPGDVVISVPHPAESVEVGDVITYQIPVEDNRIETHRITKVIEKKDGSIAIKTKGDANNGVDPWTAILQDDVVWKTEYVVPGLGKVIRAMRTPIIQDVVFWGALGALILLGLILIWKPAKADDEENDMLVADHPNALDDAALTKLAIDVDDEAFVSIFAHRYQEMLPQRLDKITAALAADDLDGALEASLSLKVSSSTVGTRELQGLAEVIELNVRRHDVAAARAAAEGLPQAVARADEALATYISEHRSA